MLTTDHNDFIARYGKNALQTYHKSLQKEPHSERKSDLTQINV
jgi:hypothetical protein